MVWTLMLVSVAEPETRRPFWGARFCQGGKAPFFVIVQALTFVAVQVRVVASPDAMRIGFAVMEAVGTSTVTGTMLDMPRPPTPSQ